MSVHPVSLADIRSAQVALADVVMRTPVLENPDVNEMLGGRLLLKAENFQRTGAFKIRGAYYRILNLTSQGTRLRHGELFVRKSRPWFGTRSATVGFVRCHRHAQRCANRKDERDPCSWRRDCNL